VSVSQGSKRGGGVRVGGEIAGGGGGQVGGERLADVEHLAEGCVDNPQVLAQLIEGVELGSQTAEGDEAIIDRGHLAGRDARQQGPVLEPLEAGMEDLPGGGASSAVRAPGSSPRRAVLARAVVVRRSERESRNMGENSWVLGSVPTISPSPLHIELPRRRVPRLSKV